jgi:hypothetical protein
MFSPHLNQYLRLLQRVKDFSIQQFVSHLAIEGFNVAVLPGTAWLDVQRSDLKPLQPVPDSFGDEFRAIV